MAVKILKDLSVGNGAPLFFIAGPCVIESQNLCLTIAKKLAEVQDALGHPIIFKASFDKANRSAFSSFRGPGLDKGLKILAKVKKRYGLPVVTDIHLPLQAKIAAQVVDILQIPAFLCRQTDLIVAAAKTGCPLLVKKGQFMSPKDVANIQSKVKSAGNRKLMIGERGTSFGYHNLVVDFKGIPAMRTLGLPVIFDATHSVQTPGGKTTGGQREMIAPLSRAAAAVGVDGFFMEVHPTPSKALSDGANALPLNRFESLARTLVRISQAAQHQP